jgi:hypothetical protein
MWNTRSNKDHAAVDEIEAGSDRAAGVIAYMIVDSLLSDALRTELHRDDSDYSRKVRHSIFDPALGAAGPFTVKVDLAYLLGFFTQDAHHDLKTMGKIRNLFAHYTEHNTFDTESIKTRCSNLKLVDERVSRPVMFSRNPATGETWPMDATGLVRNKISLHLVDRENAISTPRGRYITTAKLFIAAFTRFEEGRDKDSLLEKPIL